MLLGDTHAVPVPTSKLMDVDTVEAMFDDIMDCMGAYAAKGSANLLVTNSGMEVFNTSVDLVTKAGMKFFNYHEPDRYGVNVVLGSQGEMVRKFYRKRGDSKLYVKDHCRDSNVASMTNRDGEVELLVLREGNDNDVLLFKGFAVTLTKVESALREYYPEYW